jgi:hypothetical protein
MSLNYAQPVVTAEDYARIFELERSVAYPMVDSYEARLGVAIERERLEGAGRVLSCPMKAAPPNWQHGRVIYSTFRRYCEDRTQEGSSVYSLDIGTAKGFSALCALWAIAYARRVPVVTSVDVMPPSERCRRNTPAEVNGLRTLDEILEPWPEAKGIDFVESTGIDWLKKHKEVERIHLAFIDGKHAGDVVLKEGKMIADRQQSGDIVIFDDIQVPSVGEAVRMLDVYEVEYLQVLPGRKYGIGVRR